MSYFPPPYSPPPVFGFPPATPPEGLRPARQASVILFILGALALLAGMMFYVLSLIPLDSWPPQERDQVQGMIAPSGLTVHGALILYSLMMIFPGAAMLVMGGLVRKGRAILPTMVAVCLMVLLLVLSLLSAFAGGQAGSACPAVGVLIALIAVLARLIAVVPAVRRAKLMQAQLQSQYWQSQLFPADEEYDYGPPTDQES